MSASPFKYLPFALILLLTIVQENSGQYVPPTPTVEPLYPKGLRMSIPHENGISLVAYHVKINEDFEGLEAGFIARDIIKTRNARWTYEDRTTRLKKGDTIYYWIHVVYDGLGYNLLDQSFVVVEFYNPDGSPASSFPTDVENCRSTSETRIYDNDLNLSTVCSGQLIFEENFDTLDKNRWKIIEHFPHAPDYEFVIYMNNEDNVYISNGILNIQPIMTNDKYGPGFVRSGSLILNQCTDEAGSPNCKKNAIGAFIIPPIISGRLNTKPSFRFLYGRIEIRAKLPHGDWLYPLITLESNEEDAVNSTYYDTIMVAHSKGNPVLQKVNRNDIGGHHLTAGWLAVHLHKHQILTNKYRLPTKYSDTLWSQDFHVYELEWRRNRIAVKVDGEQYGEQREPKSYNKPVYINLGLAAGGRIFFPDNCTSSNYVKPWKSLGSKALFDFYSAQDQWIESWKQGDTKLQVDYVKVWAL